MPLSPLEDNTEKKRDSNADEKSSFYRSVYAKPRK